MYSHLKNLPKRQKFAKSGYTDANKDRLLIASKNKMNYDHSIRLDCFLAMIND